MRRLRLSDLALSGFVLPDPVAAGVGGLLLVGCLAAALPAGGADGARTHSALAYPTAEDLGQALFFDPILSLNRTQSCATCHDPGTGYADPRETVAGHAVSLGDDGASLGDRNAPGIAYARFSPPFHRAEDGTFAGGQFWDGRAADLAEQAGGPPLNPLEMAMPDSAAVVARLAEDADYAAAFRALYGAGIFDDPAAAYVALGNAIAAYEGTAEFAPFDSRYDRWLRGEYQMTREEELGRVLFFSDQFTNCNRCHQLRQSPVAADETFSNYEFHNIGVPANTAARAANGVTLPDLGLAQNPAAEGDRAGLEGRFKVPGLRNVAVTGPYMHNGVFADLRTVVLFYNKYNSKNPDRLINPETGAPWVGPEVDRNLSLEDLQHGPALDDRRVDAIVAFLKTLTDARYEDMIPE